MPRYVVFVDEYPTTVTGKVQKFKLRELGIERSSAPASRGDANGLMRDPGDCWREAVQVYWESIVDPAAIREEHPMSEFVQVVAPIQVPVELELTQALELPPHPEAVMQFSPEQVHLREAVFRQQPAESEEQQAAGLLAIWTGSMLLNDIGMQAMAAGRGGRREARAEAESGRMSSCFVNAWILGCRTRQSMGKPAFWRKRLPKNQAVTIH